MAAQNGPRNVLLLGLTGVDVPEVERRLKMSDIHLVGGSGIEDVRSMLAHTSIDHVIMGAGIDLESRLEIVREVFTASDATTVHLKDRMSGRAGFVPFVVAVLEGLQHYRP